MTSARGLKFLEFLRSDQAGRVLDDLADAWYETITAVMDTGKKGTSTLVLTAACLDRESNAITVAADVKFKLPEHDRKKSIYYPDGEGLSRSDPRQLTFDEPLQEAPRPTVIDPISRTGSDPK